MAQPRNVRIEHRKILVDGKITEDTYVFTVGASHYGPQLRISVEEAVALLKLLQEKLSSRL